MASRTIRSLRTCSASLENLIQLQLMHLRMILRVTLTKISLMSLIWMSYFGTVLSSRNNLKSLTA